MNPYRIPNKPKVTIREILPWIGKNSSVTASDLERRFKITPNDALVRVNKLWKWGYLRRVKRPPPGSVYEYSLTSFGQRTVKRWKS